MEEALREAAIDGWRDGLAQSVHSQRERAAELLAARRDRIRDLESQFTHRLDTLAQELAREQADFQSRSVLVQSREEELAHRRKELDEQLGHLAREREACEQSRQQIEALHKQLAGEAQGRLAQLDSGRQDLAHKQQQIAEREAGAARLQSELQGREAELASREADLARQTAEFQQQSLAVEAQRTVLATQQRDGETARQELEHQRTELAHRERETQRQRRQIAQQLRAKKKELTAEVELHRAESRSSSAGEELQLQMRLSELQSKHERLRDELARRDQDRDAAAAKLADLERQLAARQQELGERQAQGAQFSAQQKDLEAAHQRDAAKLQAQLDQTRQEADAVRRELGTAKAKAEDSAKVQAELDRVRRDSQQQIDSLRSQQNQSHDQQVQSLRAELDSLRKQHETERADAEKQSSEWDKQRKQFEKDLAAAKQSQSVSGDAAKELAKLRDENKQLEVWLSEAEERVKKAAAGSGGPDAEDLRKRFELALQDVRELKTKNADLAEQLAKAKKAASHASPAVVGGAALNWEAQKRILIERLESDMDGEAKLTVEGAIKITDEVVAEREQEIAELRRLLENQSQNVGDVAVGAAAIAQMLDTDELIRQERETLKGMQDKMREELKKAEVDISLERAKMARERADLDEKLRLIEADKSHLSAEGGAPGEKGKQPARGKWLARLGLKDGK